VITPADLGYAADDVAVAPPFLRQPAFLRFDPPELQDGSLVVRAVPAALRAHRRQGSGTPLGYLYEVVEGEPERDLRFAAGHFDEANLVWSFSAEITGIAGITEPSKPSSPDRPANEPPE
jgi:hypothetical protein